MSKCPDFSENLRALRDKAKLTQNQVAGQLGISRTTYCYWETGKTEPNIYNLRMLTKILNTNIRDLVGENPE